MHQRQAFRVKYFTLFHSSRTSGGRKKAQTTLIAYVTDSDFDMIHTISKACDSPTFRQYDQYSADGLPTLSSVEFCVLSVGYYVS